MATINFPSNETAVISKVLKALISLERMTAFIIILLLLLLLLLLNYYPSKVRVCTPTNQYTQIGIDW